LAPASAPADDVGASSPVETPPEPAGSEARAGGESCGAAGAVMAFAWQDPMVGSSAEALQSNPVAHMPGEAPTRQPATHSFFAALQTLGAEVVPPQL